MTASERSKLGHTKAAAAVLEAKKALESLGYLVTEPKHVCAHGADLELLGRRGWPNGHRVFAAGRPLRVEVKLAMWNVGSKAGAWRVNRVTRKKDDYIAIVFPSGHIQIEAMRDHLKLCNKSGDRYLSKLGRLFE